MTRLAVTADLHVSDYGQRVDPSTGLNARFVDAVEVLRWIAWDAADRGCDALIVAGDITEERHPSPWRVAMIVEALQEFPGPHIVVRGNHDGERAGRSIVNLLAGGLTEVHGFSRPGIAWVKRTAVCAIPYLDRHWLRAQPGFEAVTDAELFRVLGEQFQAIARGLFARARAEHPDLDDVVLVLHQGLAGGNMSEEQQAFLGDLSLVVDTGALAAIGFDAILAGHFHRHQILSTAPLVAYAGSPHRVSFSEAADPKGYLVVDTHMREVDSGGIAFEFVPTPARRFVTLEGTTWGDGGGQAFEVAEAEVEGAIVRVRDLPPELDAAHVADVLTNLGAFEVTEVRHARVEAPEATGGLSESLTAHEALEAYFGGDPEVEALVERGRAILAEVAG